jgi:NhaP-type Na+/H+ or K+/H+ antiporter
MKKIKEYFESVCIGQAVMFQNLEYRLFVFLMCFLNFANILTNQEKSVYIVCFTFMIIGYILISIKFLLQKIFQNKEINDITTSVVFIMYLVFFTYLITTYITHFVKS